MYIFKNLLELNKKIYLSGVDSISKFSFIISKILNELNKKIIIITENIEKAEIISESLNLFFNSNEKIIIDKILELNENIKILPENLYQIFKNEKKIYVLPLETALSKTISPEIFKSKILKIKKNENIDIENIKKFLVDSGYKREEKVFKKGDFSIRGDLIDIFIPIYESPLRIELFDTLIENISYFSPQTQSNLNSIEEFELIPFEIPNIKVNSSIFDYFHPDNFLLNPDNFLLILKEENNLNKSANEIFYKYENIYNENLETNNKTISPENFLLYKEEYLNKISKFDTISIQITPIENSFFLKFKEIKFNINDEISFDEINKLIKKGFKVTFVSQDNEKFKILKEKIEGLNFKKGLIDKSFLSFNFKEIYIKDEKEKNEIEEKIKESLLIHNLFKENENLNEGDYVVHIENGIGIYRGFKHIESEQLKGDFIEIEYANRTSLLLPADKINYIHKYIGDSETPPELSVLGSNKFKNIKRQVEKSIENVAIELLKIYAIRNKYSGFKFPPDNEWQKKFESEFPYNETEDQKKAILEIKKDMESEKPMDRLICGDPGYGKTELAMRAAFKAVFAGKQVAVLCPTTILAYQHFQNFKERFKNYPVKIELLSRFTTESKTKKILKELLQGKIDIIIGTHKILQDNVKFSNLGLLIIDEEQRFGVLQKEKLKKIRATIDVITLSATPIPRTLYMSLTGIRDISIVNTPPEGRKPIITKIVKFSPDIIKMAIKNELNRNGQVFFIHNRVQSIEAMTNYIKKILPEINITYVHGQMDENELEIKILEFLDKKYDVLVCTNIIETGIDIPNVNTILINRADCFGLATLYQLRGRVGRSDKEAYAYFLIPSEDAITETAKKRLLTIFEYSDLSAGYNISLRDLEIRGAGNIFGVQQHGNILAVGLKLYSEILKKTIKKLKGLEIEEEIEPEIDIEQIAYIPNSIIPSDLLKMEIYKKLNSCKTEEQLIKLKNSISNRFEINNPYFENLFKLHLIKLLSKKLKIKKIKKIIDKKYEAVIKIEFKSLNENFKISIKNQFKNVNFDNNNLIISLEKTNLLENLELFLKSIISALKI